MGVNVAQVLRQGALRWPARVAVIDVGAAHGAADGSVSYGALDAAACAVAARLHALGLGPGDRVALMAANSSSFAAAWFGVVYAGCAIVPIPILSADPEIAFRVGHAGAGAVLVDPARRAAAERACPGVPLLDVDGLTPAQPADIPHAGGARDGVRDGAPRAGDDEALPSPAPTAATPAPQTGPVDSAPEDTAMVLYTSGTTGEAKGAAISHAALMLHTAIMAHHTLRLGPDDVVAGVLPLTHSYGCRMVMLASFFAGARCVLFPRFDARGSLLGMGQYGVTWLPGVPTMFAAWGNLPDDPRAPAPARLRWALSAGAPLADATVTRAEQRLGTSVRQGYGMTEATFVSVNAPPDARVLGSVGQPVWGIEVRIVDDRGRELPAGDEGQVLVRGHNMMSHYLDAPEATAAALYDGWMHTGDVGRLDPEGRLFIVDRIKDLIIRGGNNVYPSEVEDALASHPAIAEVAVVGRPDDYYGEEIVAVVVPTNPGTGAASGAGAQPLTLSEIAAWAGQRVARTKVPRELVLVDELPVGPSGKVLKRTLRAQLAEGKLRPRTR